MIVHSLLLTFALGLSTTTLVEGLDAEGIIGGTTAWPGRIKYQISIENEFDNTCGGGIIGDNYVLTAAHCVIDKIGKFIEIPLTVLAGSLKAKNDSEPFAVRLPVEKIYVPREYDPINHTPGVPFRSVGDIAVLKLKGSLGIDSNPALEKLNLPQKSGYLIKSYSSYVGETAVVSGYGFNWVFVRENQITNDKYEVGGGSTDKLRFAEAKIISNDVCEQDSIDPIYPSNICAAVVQRSHLAKEGICSGDSGSPLVYNGDTVIGVVSTSPIGCAEDKKPAVYTRVSAYVSFIKDAMSDTKSFDMRTAVFKEPNRFFKLLGHKPHFEEV